MSSPLCRKKFRFARQLALETLEARRVFAADCLLPDWAIGDGLLDLSEQVSGGGWDAEAIEEAVAKHHEHHHHDEHHHHLHDHESGHGDEHEHEVDHHTPREILNDLGELPFGPIRPIDVSLGSASSKSELSDVSEGGFFATMSGSLFVPAFNSLPGAAASLYLDFDGHFEAIWGQYTNVTSPPLDLDGDTSTFNSDELAYIEDVWQIVAEDFSSFNINVTTIEPASLAAGVDQSIANGNAQRIAIGGGVEILGLSAGVIGYAYYNAFTSSIANVAYVMPVRSGGTIATAINVGSVASHEAGHSFGLRHQSYGFDMAKRTQTIMYGSTLGYEDQFWNNGTNDQGVLQDDMAMLANSTNGFGYRPDDHANSIAAASSLTAAGSSWVGSGIIGTQTDTDVWRLPNGNGESYRVTVRGSELGQNLDAVVELLDAGGNVLKVVDPEQSNDAEFSIALGESQYLRVRSTGEYGRVGQYQVQVAAATPGVDLLAPSTLVVSENGLTDQLSLSLQSRPTADVLVNLSVGGNVNIATSQTQLVFTTSNWSLPQTVVVSSTDNFLASGPSSFSVALAFQSIDPAYDQLTPLSVSGVRADQTAAGWAASLQGEFITLSRLQSTPSGGVVMTGLFRGAADFDLGPNENIVTSDGTDSFVAQYDRAGNLEWVLPLRSTASVSATALTVDSLGNVYLGGSNSGIDLTIGSTTVATNKGSSDAFVAKIAPSGSVAWARSWGGAEGDNLYQIAVDAAGNLTLLGNFSATTDFDPSSGTALRTSAGGADGFVLQLTSAGSFASVITFGGINNDWPRQLEVDPAGNLYISGYFVTATQLGNQALVSSGSSDGYLMKMTPTGSVTWTRQLFSETGSGVNLELTRSPQGRIYWGTQFSGDLNFGPGTPTISNAGIGNGIFVSVWDEEGNSIAVGTQASDANLSLADLSTDASGNLIMLGRMRGEADLSLTVGVDNFQPLTGQADFIVRTDPDLNLTDVHILPVTSTTGSANSLAIDGSGNLFATGTYGGQAIMPTGDVLTLSDRTAGYLVHLKWNPGVSISNSSPLETSEAGGQVTLALTLNTAPTADVVLSLLSSDVSEGSVTPNQIVFTPSNWNQPQQVMVTGLDDSLMDGDQNYSIHLTLASSDPVYHQLAVSAVNLVNRDDDQPRVLFQDSFEVGEWNGLWIEDSQNDWFRSTQRATAGSYSAEVDGSAANATLTTASAIDLSDMDSAELTFDWLIESGFDSGEYLSLDISTNGGATWVQDVRRLNGNVSPENTWHSEVVNLTPFLSSQLRARFRARASGSDEDANVDNVRITGMLAGPNTPPVADAGSGYIVNEGASVVLSGLGSFDSDGTIVTYAWDLDNDGQYDDASGLTVNFSTVNSGLRTVGLRVTDNRGATATASAAITVNNVAPTANAGADQNVVLGTPVTLSASGSFDPGLDILDYLWDVDNDGLFDDASGIAPSFNPSAVGDYLISLQVIDADGATSVDQMLLVVSTPPTETTLFEDSFEVSEWNGLWVEDSQNDWFRSTQRATHGQRSAEVDGFANNATLTMANGINLSSYANTMLTYDWLIESGFDSGEFLALDISTNGGTSWIENVRRLNGDVSAEDVWHSETVNLSVYASSNLKIRFRSSVSGSAEDANVDNVKIIASNDPAPLGSIWATNIDDYFAELTKKRVRTR